MGICGHTMEVFRFPFICGLAGCVHAMHLVLTRGIATSPPCSLATIPALERPGCCRQSGAGVNSGPTRGPGVCWCVGSFLLAVRKNSAPQPAELLSVPSHKLADFPLNVHIILAWLLNECRRCWEMHVDLQTAGDIVWFTETPIADKILIKATSHSL